MRRKYKYNKFGISINQKKNHFFFVWIFIYMFICYGCGCGGHPINFFLLIENLFFFVSKLFVNCYEIDCINMIFC